MYSWRVQITATISIAKNERKDYIVANKVKFHFHFKVDDFDESLCLSLLHFYVAFPSRPDIIYMCGRISWVNYSQFQEYF